MKDLLEEFKENICKNCLQEECPKGITFIEYNDMDQVTCFDYIKKNVESYKKPE